MLAHIHRLDELHRDSYYHYYNNYYCYHYYYGLLLDIATRWHDCKVQW